MRRVRVETWLAVTFFAAAAITSVWPDWIEAFGWDPDHGDGSAEWAFVAVFGVLAAVTGLLALRDRHRQAAHANV